MTSVLLDHHVSASRSLPGLVAAADVLIRELGSRSMLDLEAARPDADAALEAVGLDQAGWQELLASVRLEIEELLSAFEVGPV